MRYFVDVNGVIYTLFDTGLSNFPCEDMKFVFHDPYIDLICPDGEVHETYQLWDSLVELAKAIEIY